MIGGKWKTEILYYVALEDVRHFGELRRCLRDLLLVFERFVTLPTTRGCASETAT